MTAPFESLSSSEMLLIERQAAIQMRLILRQPESRTKSCFIIRWQQNMATTVAKPS